MFKLFPEQADDLLDIASLPPASNTELNYRTRPLTSAQETRLSLVLLLCPVPVALILGVLFWILTNVHPWLETGCFAIAIAIAGLLSFRFLTKAVKRWELVFGILFAIGLFLGSIWELALSLDVWAWRIGLVVAWLSSCLIARQVAAWHLAAPTVDYERGKRWKVNLPRIFSVRYSFDCPELLTYSLGLILIGPAWFLSVWLSSEWFNLHWLWPICFPVAALLLWTAVHTLLIPLIPFPNLFQTVKSTWKGLVVFLTYDIHFTHAPGVFRFPTRWLRDPVARWLLTICTLIGVSFGFASGFPNPFDPLQNNVGVFGQIVGNFLTIALSGPIVLISVLWLVAGSLLARFHRELSFHSDKHRSDWDNYVDRIINSNDELERNHILLGTTEKGDYPVLVHRDIYDQHGHILGDSGASKTALGIAPQATQLIARADSSVVIVDLKGDDALFHSCKREAERAGLRFRWVSNEVGKTTFGFNPFTQSHNQLLSVEQMTQQLLQGLSLDYGIQYGASYYTAMNEIVLKNVLKEGGDMSFRQLNKHLSDGDWYASIGDKEDWKKARHLAALVNRLAASDPINVMPSMFTDRPEVLENAIDVSDVLANPQVVYLNLKSPVEPTNAPTIARLFLWCMFNAASHQPKDNNRVYLFIDEVQQIVSDGIKLIFEQFRDLGGTIIAAHQTSGQLRRQGSDLGDTIDSCTAVKQVFRASDLRSVESLEKLSGVKQQRVPTWHQTHERGFGDFMERYDPIHAAEGQVRVSQQESPRFNRQEILAIGSRRHSSLLRFTFGSGYTQFAGATVPIVSQFHISFAEYLRRRQLKWPTHPGAFEIQAPAHHDANGSEVCSPKQTQPVPPDFGSVFDERARQVLSG